MGLGPPAPHEEKGLSMTEDRYPPDSGTYRGDGTPGYGSGAAAPPQRSNGVAIAALVCGIVALLLSWIPGINLLSFLLGIIALICGAIGLSKAKDPGVGGRGLAIGGIVTGLLALIIGVLVYVGLFRLANNPEVQERASELQEQIEDAASEG